MEGTPIAAIVGIALISATFGEAIGWLIASLHYQSKEYLEQRRRIEEQRTRVLEALKESIGRANR